MVCLPLITERNAHEMCLTLDCLQIVRCLLWSQTTTLSLRNINPMFEGSNLCVNFFGSPSTINSSAAEICFKNQWMMNLKGLGQHINPRDQRKVSLLKPWKQNGQGKTSAEFHSSCLATHFGEHTKDDIGPLSAESRRTAYFLVNSSGALPPRYLQLNAQCAQCNMYNKYRL